MLGVVQPIDAKARLGEQVRVPTLAAWHVEHARAGRQREQLDETRYLAPVARQVEDRLVLEEVVRVEVRRPPFARVAVFAATQKKTGSR